MKTLSLLAAIALTSCVSTETVTTAPDGTMTRTVIKGVDSASVVAAAAIASALAPTIIPEK